MGDDSDDVDDELGQVGEQVGGIANRFGAGESESAETSETNEMSETMETTESTPTPSAETSETTEASETTEVPQPGDDAFQLREHWNGRTIYLPDDVVDDLDLRYKECSIQWQQQHGGELPKNEQFYPAVVKAALRGTSIESELDLKE